MVSQKLSRKTGTSGSMLAGIAIGIWWIRSNARQVAGSAAKR
jgi:hypothetical protein